MPKSNSSKNLKVETNFDNSVAGASLQNPMELDVLAVRRAGVLCHPSSLPGPLATGDFSHQAYRFIEFLNASKLSVWQMLPLGPVHNDHSPYQCKSVYAGNPYLISLDWLVDKKLLDKKSIVPSKKFNSTAECDTFRLRKLQQAFDRFLQLQNKELIYDFNVFIHANDEWLNNYALFSCIRQDQNELPWYQWPPALRDRDHAALAEVEHKLQYAIYREKFIQFVFHQQWYELKQYANDNNVYLFGDVPIFVAHDSADVWQARDVFSIADNGTLITTTGVPPDYFSKNGQRWGNPQYNWDKLQQNNFSWWRERLDSQIKLFDLIRIDHFRGFEAYWEIDAKSKTAVNGKWVKAPGDAFFNSIQQYLGKLPLVAEDLGTISEEVNILRRKYKIPGMKVLQFAFDGDSNNSYLPFNHELNSVVYTGTHDNDTSLSWYQLLPKQSRNYMNNYFGFDIGPTMPWPLIRAAMSSRSNLAILPMQDLLSLATGNRMNLPGSTQGNWNWRFNWEQLPDHLVSTLSGLIKLYSRDN